MGTSMVGQTSVQRVRSELSEPWVREPIPEKISGIGAGADQGLTARGVQREDRLTQVGAEIDRVLDLLLARVGRRQRPQRPFEAGDRLPVGRAGESLGTRSVRGSRHARRCIDRPRTVKDVSAAACATPPNRALVTSTVWR